jgi:uncharacterized iron-regulated membrane protein
MSRGFRQSQSMLHTWSGLLLGWVLFIIFVAGSAAYWREALNRWMRPESPRIEQPLAALEGAVRFLERKAPGAKSWSIAMPTTEGPGTHVFWVLQPSVGAAAASQGESRDETSALIDASGAPVARDTRGGEFFYRFHFDLHYVPIVWARWFVGVATMLMLVALLTGIVTHKKIFRDFFTLRRGKGQRSWLDGHNAAGVLGLPFHLMISYTGLVALATMLMPWAIVANYADGNKLFETLFPHAEEVARSGRAVPMVNLSALVRDGEARLGGRIGYIEVSEPGDASARVTLTGASSATLSTYGARLLYDGTTGRLLWRSPPADAAFTTYGAMVGLHAGRFGDIGFRWLYFLCGVGGTLMVASGLVLWTVKRREKLPDPARPSFGFRVVERLNIAVIVGFPLGCTVSFWANRLLPLGIGKRADREIAVLFVTWGIAALITLMVRPRNSWVLLLSTAAISLTGIVGFDLLILHPGLVTWIATGDWALVSVDLVLVTFAAFLAWTARRVARHRPRNRTSRASRAAELDSACLMQRHRK